METDGSFFIGLNAVIVAVTQEVPRILIVRRPEHEPPDALPFGPLDPEEDRTLERGLRNWVRSQTGFDLGYVEQLYTFGDRNRDPSEREGGPRVLSVAYLTLVREAVPPGRDAHFRDVYRFLPWEDWREGRPRLIDDVITPALRAWVETTDDPELGQARRERVDITFGLRGVSWDGERVLERYELLYEAGLVMEALRDRAMRHGESPETTEPHTFVGQGMALDHRRILATGLGRIRGKLKYRPVVFELLPPTFTLLHLQRVVEALSGVELHKQNFRRLVERGGLVEGTGELDPATGGRPAELFRFRREVLRERPAPGVGLPGTRR